MGTGTTGDTGVNGFEAFPRARATLEAGLVEGAFPGFVAGVWDARAPAEERLALGGATAVAFARDAGGADARDTVFDLASVSKVYGTAGLAAALVERGWISWETRARALLPGFRWPEITLGQLAAHTAGLPAWAPLFEAMRASFAYDDLETITVETRQAIMRELVCEVDLDRAPGTKAVYSDIGFLVLGFCLEEVTGLPLDRAVRRFFWDPLGVPSARDGGPYYAPVDAPAFRGIREDVAATEESGWRKAVLQGQVHDDNAWAMGGYGGHAGIFGTAGNLLDYGRRLLGYGGPAGVQAPPAPGTAPRPLGGGVLSPSVLRRMWTRVAEPDGCERTLGWDTPSGEHPAFGALFSPRSIGHLGYTGTSFWIDPDAGIVVTLLTNRVHPSRENTRIRAFRGEFHEALARDLGFGDDGRRGPRADPARE